MSLRVINQYAHGSWVRVSERSSARVVCTAFAELSPQVVADNDGDEAWVEGLLETISTLEKMDGGDLIAIDRSL
jgi:hypothetical protein